MKDSEYMGCLLIAIILTVQAFVIVSLASSVFLVWQGGFYGIVGLIGSHIISNFVLFRSRQNANRH